MEFSSSFLGWIVGGLATVFLIWGNKKKADLQSELDVAKHDKVDAILLERQANVEGAIAEAVAENEQARKAMLTPEELAKELNKI